MFRFHCFTVHFNSLNFTHQLMHLYIIIIIFLHGFCRLTCSGIDVLPSFPGVSTISSPPRFVFEGMFQKSGVVYSFEMVDPVLFVFGLHVLYSRSLSLYMFCVCWSGIQDVKSKYNKTGSTISKEWTTPDFRNTPSNTNLGGEEIVDAPGKDSNASMPEQVK